MESHHAAWKNLLPKLTFIPPTNIYKLLCCSLWHCPTITLIGLGFSRIRASHLYYSGMRTYKDVWNGSRFITIPEAELKFGLAPREVGAWEAACRIMEGAWNSLLRFRGMSFPTGDWVGICRADDDPLPHSVFQISATCNPARDATQTWLPTSVNLHQVIENTRCLVLVSASLRDIPHKVRVDQVKHGQQKISILLFYGRIDRL